MIKGYHQSQVDRGKYTHGFHPIPVHLEKRQFSERGYAIQGVVFLCWSLRRSTPPQWRKPPPVMGSDSFKECTPEINRELAGRRAGGPIQNEVAYGPPFVPTHTEDLDPFMGARSQRGLGMIRPGHGWKEGCDAERSRSKPGPVTRLFVILQPQYNAFGWCRLAVEVPELASKEASPRPLFS